ncbi:DNA cytosine methyltransferase [Catellatospora sp. NPDC049609]|uniref:DNA cytosine methyltransferase n=1 Tax=Catellatospora sp. NPDC049609 TaxID=3155505 RepID=UPI003444CF45
MPSAATPSSFKIVDLFAGPGGLDSAARELGVPAVGVEWDVNACATRYAEHLETSSRDVRDLGPEDFEDANVLAGGPPCQTFTVAGNGTGRRALDQVLTFARRLAGGENRESVRADLKGLSDERTGLVLEPLRWILQAIEDGRPYEAVILEQVPAVLPVWEAFAAIMRERGYQVPPPKVLHTEEFGVPQTRRRAILIARWGDSDLWRRSGEPTLPEPTHRRFRKGLDNHAVDATLPWITMGEALQRHRHGEFVVVSNYGTGGDPKARGRRHSYEPSATVTGKISRNRVLDTRGVELPRLSLNEAGLLQTFRDGYKWSGGDIAQQIGNAVPPRLGMHVIAAALQLPEQLSFALDRQP